MKEPDDVPESRLAKLRDDLDVIDDAELARLCGVEDKTITNWAASRTGPPFTKVGNRRFYQKSSVKRWLENAENITDGRAPTLRNKSKGDNAAKGEGEVEAAQLEYRSETQTAGDL